MLGFFVKYLFSTTIFKLLFFYSSYFRCQFGSLYWRIHKKFEADFTIFLNFSIYCYRIFDTRLPSKEIEANEAGKKVIKTEQCINAIDTSLPHLRQQQNTPSLTHLVPARLRIRQMNLIAETQPPFNRAILRPKIAEPNLPRARLHRSPIKRSRKEPHRGQEGEGGERGEKVAPVFSLLCKAGHFLPLRCRSVEPGG